LPCIRKMGETGMRIIKITEKERNNILQNLLKRSPGQYGKYEEKVKKIL